MSVSITDEELQRLTGQIRAAQSENFELREQVGALIANNAKINDELERQTKSLIDSQVAAARAANRIKDDVGGKKKSRFDKLVDKVKEKDRDFQGEIDVLQAQLVSQDSEKVRLAAMEQNTRHLQQFAREMQLDMAEKEKEVAELRETADSLRKVIDEQPDLQERERGMDASKVVAALEAQLDAERATAAAATKAADAATGKLRALEDSTAAMLEDTATKCIAHEKALGAKNEEIARLKGLEQVVGNLQKAAKEQEEEVRKKDADCAAWKEQCEQIGKLLVESKDAAFTAGKEGKEKGNALDELQKLLAQANEALELERKLRKEAATNLCEMRVQNTQLNERLEQVTAATADTEALQKTIASQQSHLASLKEAVRVRDAASDRNQIGYDKLKKDLAAAQLNAQEVEALQTELADLRGAVAGSLCEAVVASVVDAAAYEAEAAAAAKHRAASEGLEAAEATAAQLRARVDAFDQQLNDLRSEHKIDIKKKDMKIRELQSQLRSAARNVPDDASSCGGATPSPFAAGKSPRLDESTSSYVDPMPPPPMPLGGSVAGHPPPIEGSVDLASMQREEDVLIRKVAELKEANWRLEEEGRNQDKLLRHLREDNEKKNVILENWLTGPAVEQLLKDKKKLLVPKQQQTWLGMMGTAVASTKQSTINEKLQGLLQDTLSQNILLQRRIEALERGSGSSTDAPRTPS
eukprot:TRINITY_DN7120_c0_g1_i1.p1 TRINITY_DN7120_c0_g1~~TRINITY_DN7120_c0_g1_i1.p1  ORF type:complete len:698 (+),score=295.78 TRINITY_DN7120_c0_g1_i1:96-2189(+)